MLDLPLVFVVLVNWNGLSDTRECLTSLAGIDYPNAHVIVVDNGSSGGDAAALRAEFPNVAVVEAGRNLGFTGGNNVGIRHALAGGADYVLCLNNDTVVAPDFLGPLVDALEADPGAGIATGSIFYSDRPQTLSALGSRLDLTQPSPASHRTSLDGLAVRADGAAVVPAVDGCVLLMRRAVAEATGGFDERFFAYAEDADLCLRARALGWHCLAVPASRVWHKVGSTTGGELSPTSLYYGVRNARLLLLTHGTPRQKRLGTLRYLAAYLPQLLCPEPEKLESLLQALWCAVLGRWGARSASDELRPACAHMARRLLRVSRWHWRLNSLRQRRPFRT